MKSVIDNTLQYFIEIHQEVTRKLIMTLHRINLHQVKQENKDQKSTFCGFNGAGASSSQVVPVLILSKESGVVVKTNAMLDECSDTVFLTDRLKNKLKWKGTKTKISLQTIMGEKDVESQSITGLEVMDPNGQNVIQFPRSYTCPSIQQVLLTHMPTNEMMTF